MLACAHEVVHDVVVVCHACEHTLYHVLLLARWYLSYDVIVRTQK